MKFRNGRARFITNGALRKSTNPLKLRRFDPKHLSISWVYFFFALSAAYAQTPSQDNFGPNLWDPKQRLEKPDLGQIRSLHFLTTDDYPPFHFALPDETDPLGGFDIDLARAICQELKLIEPRLTCTIQARNWDILTDSLDSDPANIIMGAIPINSQTRLKFGFTSPYYKTPGRFAARKDKNLSDEIPESLTGKTIGVLAKTSHAAFIARYFMGSKTLPYDSREAMREALQKGEIDTLFDDAISLSLWLNGTESEDCCTFVSGPYLDSRYFNEGVGLTVQKGNYALIQVLNYALAELAAKGTIEELYLKYFPIGFY